MATAVGSVFVMDRMQMEKTLQELEGHDWGEPTFPSNLVRRCHALRRKRIRDFTVEDLRLMIGQGIGLDYLVPLAIEHLRGDPLVAGDFYAGDLLVQVLKVETGFWHARPELRREVETIVKGIGTLPEEVQRVLRGVQGSSGRVHE